MKDNAVGYMLVHAVGTPLPELADFELVVDPLGPRFESEVIAKATIVSFVQRDRTKDWSVFTNAIPVYVKIAEAGVIKSMVNPDYTNAPFEILFYRKKCPTHSNN